MSFIFLLLVIYLDLKVLKWLLEKEHKEEFNNIIVNNTRPINKQQYVPIYIEEALEDYSYFLETKHNIQKRNLETVEGTIWDEEANLLLFRKRYGLIS